MPFADLTGRIDLLNPVSVVGLLATLREVHDVTPQAELILIVDTVARAMVGGDENSSQDMGALIGTCDPIRAELACTVLLIHHAGKDTTKGAAATPACVAPSTPRSRSTGTVNPRVVTVRKQRDLPSGESFAFDLEPVELGTDPETFDPITACVAVHRDVRARPRRTASDLREPAPRAARDRGAVDGCLAAGRPAGSSRPIVSPRP